MQVRQLPASTLTAVNALLEPYCRDLTPQKLVSALRVFEDTDTPKPLPLLRPRDAAKILGVSPWTVMRDVREGKLPGVKVRGQWRVQAAKVYALVQAGEPSRD